ncbi:RAD50-interacting 1 [Brachionus plicatilis]|uniref:RAD50-interacting 1 n=1 Tax=Brachionus plicatilis TaxID=10195 RepID=A0A3M7QSE8_BRAPC|nr:RAD50-interacting 1 [Brachionus plicatilis]
MSLMQLETISADTVDKINGLINVDQNLLFDHDKFREISFKLNKKINALKDNIAVSLPSQFSTLDQNEFLLFCSRIRSLSKKLELIKKKEQKIRHSTNNFKLAIESNKDDYSTNGLLKQFILKSLSLSRERDYFSTLITLENNKLEIEKKLQKYNLICEKKRLVENSRKKQSGNTDQEINLHIEQAEVLKDLLLSYQELKAVSKSLIETRCTNLRTYMIDLLAFIQKQLREILTDELEASLQKLNYPHVTLEVNRAENLENLRKKIHDHIYYLLVIDVPFLEEEQDGVCSQNSVIETLIKPFEKRFKFHFFTSRKTNDINKPEWYLSQILQWIKEQQDFFSRLIQPIFDKIEYWNKKSALLHQNACGARLAVVWLCRNF